jgi:hypothetical protein
MSCYALLAICSKNWLLIPNAMERTPRVSARNETEVQRRRKPRFWIAPAEEAEDE